MRSAISNESPGEEPPRRGIILDVAIFVLPVLIRSLDTGGNEWIAVGIAVFWALFVRRIRIVMGPIFWAGAVLVALSYVSALFGIDPEYSVRVAHTIALAVGYIIVLSAYFGQNTRAIRPTLVALWGVGLLHALVFSIDATRRTLNIDASVGRSSLEDINSNISGWILAVGVWAGVYILASRNYRPPLLWQGLAGFASLVFMTGQLIETGSRTSLVSVIVAVTVLLLRGAPRLLHGVAAVSLATAVVFSIWNALLTSVAALGAGLPLVAEFSRYRGADGLNGRADLWLFIHEYVRALPLLGEGHGSYRVYLGGALGTHNFVLEAWAGMGLLGLIAYLIFLLSILIAPKGGVTAMSDELLCLSGSAFMLIIPTFFASTQFWVAPSAILLGLAGARAGSRSAPDRKQGVTRGSTVSPPSRLPAAGVGTSAVSQS